MRLTNIPEIVSVSIRKPNIMNKKNDFNQNVGILSKNKLNITIFYTFNMKY